jgi:putative aminopeptidase FrvX
MAPMHSFGNDASISSRAGLVPEVARLGFSTANTHGYEIAHLDAIARCVDVLEELCNQGL